MQKAAYLGTAKRIRVSGGVKFEPRDLWVGVFWDMQGRPGGLLRSFRLYVCLVPMIPLWLRISWIKKATP